MAKKGVEDDEWINIENEVKSIYLIREEDIGYNLRTKVSFIDMMIKDIIE